MRLDLETLGWTNRYVIKSNFDPKEAIHIVESHAAFTCSHAFVKEAPRKYDASGVWKSTLLSNDSLR